MVCHRAAAALTACLASLALAACGGGERQDEDEPEGNFRVDVVRASFPENQRLAKTSELEITVRNAGRRTVPNIAVTVNGFDRRVKQEAGRIPPGTPELADPERPVFVINGQPRRIGGFIDSKPAAPEGGETAYVDTWALGSLRPDAEKTFRWSVTAVKAGPFEIEYRVAAGLAGKAKAIDARGKTPSGVFAGAISDEAPATRIAEDGVTVVEGTR